MSNEKKKIIPGKRKKWSGPTETDVKEFEQLLNEYSDDNKEFNDLLEKVKFKKKDDLEVFKRLPVSVNDKVQLLLSMMREQAVMHSLRDDKARLKLKPISCSDQLPKGKPVLKRA